MGKKRVVEREAATGTDPGGIAGAVCGVPEVRGDDPTPTVTDLPRVSRLSRVSTDNSDGKPQEVSPSLEKVAKRKLEPPKRAVSEMTLDEKLAILNAFKTIRHSPPKVKDIQARDLIRELYFKWIDDTMLQILHPGLQISSSFSPEELDALKVLAQTIIQRQQGSAAGSPAPAPMIPRAGAKPQAQAAPLNPGVDSAKLQKAQLAFLQELQKMEREGPQF